MKEDLAIAARFNLAMTALNTGRDTLAINIFKDLIELRPGFIEAHIAVGVGYGKLENFKGMVEAFTQAIRIDRAAVRKLVHAMVTSALRLPDEEINALDKSAQMEEFLRELDKPRVLIARAAEDLMEERDLAAIRALERSLTLAYPYQLGMIVITIAYLIVESMVKGAAAQVGEKSVLKEVEPQLAACLFGSQ
jgi:tetratricopeptide (TPR) repeat protein